MWPRADGRSTSEALLEQSFQMNFLERFGLPMCDAGAGVILLGTLFCCVSLKKAGGRGSSRMYRLCMN